MGGTACFNQLKFIQPRRKKLQGEERLPTQRWAIPGDLGMEYMSIGFGMTREVK